ELFGRIHRYDASTTGRAVVVNLAGVPTVVTVSRPNRLGRWRYADRRDAGSTDPWRASDGGAGVPPVRKATGKSCYGRVLGKRHGEVGRLVHVQTRSCLSAAGHE